MKSRPRPPRASALGARRHVVAEGLHRELPDGPAVRDARVLLARERVQQPQAPAAGRAAAELGRAQDGGAGRRVHVLAVGRALGVAADAARVVQLRVGPVEAPEVVRAAAGEAAQQVGALDEEGPLLLEVGLGVAQVDHGRVDLDLAEVGVERGVEGQAAGQAVLQVEAPLQRLLRAVVEGVAGAGRGHLIAARDHVGQQRQVPARLQARQARQVGHARGQPGLFLGHQLEPALLVAALDAGHHVEGRRRPGGIAAGKPQLRERQAQLEGRPALFAARDGRIPHAVPGAVVPRVVEQDRVALHAGGADLEVHAGLVVVGRVQVDPHQVGVGLGIAAPQAPHDLVRLAVLQDQQHVQGRVVVGHAHFGGLAGRPALLGVALAGKARRPARPAAGHVVVAAVDGRRAGGAHGQVGGDLLGARLLGGQRRGREERADQQGRQRRARDRQHADGTTAAGRGLQEPAEKAPPRPAAWTLPALPGTVADPRRLTQAPLQLGQVGAAGAAVPPRPRRRGAP